MFKFPKPYVIAFCIRSVCAMNYLMTCNFILDSIKRSNELCEVIYDIRQNNFEKKIGVIPMGLSGSGTVTY